MSGNPSIRESRPDDHAALEELYPAAFPDEELRPVVRELLPRSDVLSLVAILDEQVVGHVMFTICGVEGGNVRAALLAPLAVAPAVQRRGIGSAIVRNGLERLGDDGIEVVLVLGDPNYYGRFGFEPERDIRTPQPIPTEWADAWRSITLGDVPTKPVGALDVPEAWKHPELWSP